jgi:glycosyltransferase involved in cell wall biosynthesis
MFGALAPYKNIEVVLRAFADPALADLDLVLIGTTAAQLAAAGFTPPPRCLFAPKADDAALKALYENALCLAYPSRTEGFGLPPLEAMGCGAPAVVAPAGAIPEICQDAVLYAGVADPTAWVRAFLALAQDEGLRQQKQALGRERAAGFTWKRAGEGLLDAILRHAG